MAPRTQIVFVTYSFGSGGAEKQQLWMARTLTRQGYACVMSELKVNPGNQRLSRLIEAAQEDGVQFSYARPGETYFRAWRRLRALTRASVPTLLWTWGFKADLVALFARRRAKDHFWFSSLRSADLPRTRRWAWLYRLCRPWVSRYVSNTETNCDILESVCPGVRSLCRLVPNVVEELSAESQPLPSVLPNPFRVMMLGNIVQPTKGYDIALEVGSRLKEARLPVEIHIAGRPDPTGWLSAEIARRNLAPTVTYHGETGDPHGFLASGHAYLLLSRIEGMPNSLLEATSLGLPSIVTRVGDLDRWAKEAAPFWVIDFDDAEAALQAIKAILADWPAAVALGRRGEAWCRATFHPLVCERKLLAVVSEVFPANR